MPRCKYSFPVKQDYAKSGWPFSEHGENSMRGAKKCPGLRRDWSALTWAIGNSLCKDFLFFRSFLLKNQKGACSTILFWERCLNILTFSKRFKKRVFWVSCSSRCQKVMKQNSKKGEYWSFKVNIMSYIDNLPTELCNEPYTFL